MLVYTQKKGDFMLYNADTKVGKYWDYPKKKIDDNTSLEIKMVCDYQDCLLKKNCEWTEKGYCDFSSVIKQAKLSDFVNCITFHNEILNLSKKEIRAEMINLFHKGILLPNPKIDSIYSMIAIMSLEIQRRVLQFSTYAVFKCEIDSNGSIEERIEKYQQLLTELQNVDSNYSQFIINSFREWVNQTFQSTSLKDSILSMQNYVLMNNIKSVRQKIKKDSAILAKSKDVIGKYKYSCINKRM